MKNLIITGIILLIVAIIISVIMISKKSHPLSHPPITDETPINIIIEENDSNFGHVNLVAKGSHLSDRNNHVYNVFNENDSLLPLLKLDTLAITDNLTQDINNIQPLNNYFKLYRYSLWYPENPVSTKHPSLSLSLFKPNLDSWDRYWAARYFASQLKMMMVFNYYFPKGSVRAYLCYYMMNYLKTYTAKDLDVGSLVEEPHCQFEDKQFNTNMLFQRFDEFMANNSKTFANAYEKFMYYYTIASKIYNDTDSDYVIMNNKGGDFYIYKFEGDFTEKVRTYTTHISDGFIGQMMRYICLRQKDYDYNGSIIKRNKHYVFRDGHQNQTGPNDAENIKYFNKYVSQSKGKIFNMIPCDNYYRAPWHQFVSCPANPQTYQVRSAIAGVVQMANFKNTPYWLTDELYYKTIGLAFLVNDDGRVAIKIHRPLQDKGNNVVLKEFQYGIEEYLFNTLFFLDYYRNLNIYYQDRFLWDVFRFNDSNIGNWVENWKPILKIQIILFLYLYKNNLLNTTFNAFDFFHAVENLRWNPPKNQNEKYWLGFMLSVYPTKYFIQQTIFNKGFEARNGGYIPPEYESINKDFVYNMLSQWKDFHVYNTDMDKWVWKTNGFLGAPTGNPKDFLEFVTRNSPIINSNVEWCVDPYLNITNMYPVSTFFSGFYKDKPGSLKYGIFRQPSEIYDVIKALEKSKEIILYKNILIKTNKLLKLSSSSFSPSTLSAKAQQEIDKDSAKNWQDVISGMMV